MAHQLFSVRYSSFWPSAQIVDVERQGVDLSRQSEVWVCESRSFGYGALSNQLVGFGQ